MRDVRHLYSGKVRDLYDLDGDLLLVASDRVSVYDTVLPTPIPGKGEILTALSVWWFEQLADVVEHHLISATDVPAEFAGRAVRCRRLEMLPVECIARGYLTGLGLAEYRRTGGVSGLTLPTGLQQGSRLPEPVFTPTTKDTTGGHDEFITLDDVAAQVGTETAERLRELTLNLYSTAAARAAEVGLILADTKFEFGLDPTTGAIVLADEACTPDSSRYWLAERWAPGADPYPLDKQYVREWANSTGWDHSPPGPAVPDDVVAEASRRYRDVLGRLRRS